MNDNLFFEIQKAVEVCSTFDRYRLVRWSPLKLNTRCPICGDSEKSKIKARFWVNEKDGALLVGCFNCGYHSNFTSFCKDYQPETFKELMFQKYNKDKPSNQQKQELPKEHGNSLKVSEKSNIEIKVKKYCKCVNELPETHPIVKYIKNRQIPEEFYDYFWFTDKWQELVHAIQPESYEDPKPEYRLVMIIKDFDKRWTAIQGRSLEDNPRNKYITIKESDAANKIFGLDRVDINKMVFLVEGIVDSLFIDNAIAITGGSLNFDEIPVKKENRVWCWDNEPYAEHTIKRIEKAVENNENIVLFDKTQWQSKDINDLIVKENISQKEVNNYLKENIINGLMAQLRFKQWRKI